MLSCCVNIVCVFPNVFLPLQILNIMFRWNLFLLVYFHCIDWKWCPGVLVKCPVLPELFQPWRSTVVIKKYCTVVNYICNVLSVLNFDFTWTNSARIVKSPPPLKFPLINKASIFIIKCGSCICLNGPLFFLFSQYHLLKTKLKSWIFSGFLQHLTTLGCCMFQLQQTFEM